MELRRSCFLLEDFQEGQAFAEKRQPDWKGR